MTQRNGFVELIFLRVVWQSTDILTISTLCTAISPEPHIYSRLQTTMAQLQWKFSILILLSILVLYIEAKSSKTKDKQLHSSQHDHTRHGHHHNTSNDGELERKKRQISRQQFDNYLNNVNNPNYDPRMEEGSCGLFIHIMHYYPKLWIEFTICTVTRNFGWIYSCSLLR